MWPESKNSKKRNREYENQTFRKQVSISPTFYVQLFCQYSFAKKIQSKWKKDLPNTFFQKMLVTLILGLDFINVLRTAFTTSDPERVKRY